MAALVFAVGAQAVGAAAISDEEELVQFGGLGAGAGELNLPWGVASDPTTGHVFTVEEGANNRISEFTPWGKFVKAFGWDVAPGAVNEQQEVRVRASEGQFKLKLGAETTGNLPLGASGAEVDAAVEGLVAIGAGGVSVEVNPGNADGTSPFIYVVIFNGPALAGTNVPSLEALNGTLPLSGGVPSTSLLALTRADGHAASTGLESCTEESGCKAGLSGAGAGQLNRGRGVAVDGAGNAYVREVNNHRVQKFDSAGRFVLMFGGGVDESTGEDICTAASGDSCRIGAVGAGPGQFGESLSGGIALCSGSLFVADKGRIQRFGLGGEFEAELPESGKAVQSLACDAAGGGLYATFEPESNVRKLDTATGNEVDKVEVEGLGGIASDSAGDLFAVGQVGGNGNEAVLEFNPSGDPLAPSNCCEGAPFGLQGLGTNSAGDLYASYRSPGVDSFLRAYGPPPTGFEPPPAVPPEITAQFASSVQREGATVAAEINPHFFSDTRYFVQYGTGECRAGGCGEETPLPPGALLSKKVTAASLPTAAVFLEGLKPGTTYHYRFIAQSSGGGPVYGIDPDGEGPEEASAGVGEEGAFTTFSEPFPTKACANDVLRIGPAKRLADCRAYEMVSPVDKNNGDIKTVPNIPGFDTSLSQSAVGGERFSYSSYRSFGGPEGAPYTSQYLASRDPEAGWSNAAIDPAQASRFDSEMLEAHYKAFSADLCLGWLVVAAEPVLAPGASKGYRDLYRRDNCGGGGYEALITTQPVISIGAFVPMLEGTAADRGAAIVMVEEKLTADAASGVWQTYYASGGQLHLLCILPSGAAIGKRNCSGGTQGEIGVQPSLERLGSLDNALSADGSRAYWTDSGAKPSGTGTIYLRENPGEEQSALSGGTCTEPEKACTVKVSETQTTNTSRFLRASTDGAKALFEVTEGSKEGKLYEFSLGAGSALIAGKVLGVAGASEDLSRVYFISEAKLAGTTGATEGKPNLYLREEEEGGGASLTFIATLAKADAANKPPLSKAPSDATSEAIFHAARATPDGKVLTFLSTERLTGYDNTDLSSGEADSEVYIYEAGAPGPVCVSCNPSGARPAGRLVQANGHSANLATASSLAMPTYQLHSPRVLSEDGRRLFFNSFDALLPRDTNGKEDVYEWESSASQAGCEEKGAELYVASAEGCLSLISTGGSPLDSELLDASANGNDAFFTTVASLLPRDPGLIDVYDARVLGGIPEPTSPPAPCQGETCQPAVTAPSDPTPSSSAYEGPGNLEEKPKKHHKKHHKKKKAHRATRGRGR